jgi:hypothetical protein
MPWSSVHVSYWECSVIESLAYFILILGLRADVDIVLQVECVCHTTSLVSQYHVRNSISITLILHVWILLCKSCQNSKLWKLHGGLVRQAMLSHHHSSLYSH